MSSALLNSRINRYAGIILGALVWLANSSNPPNGRTGSPFDGNCNQCHSGNQNGYNGIVSISGLPSTIAPNTTYDLNIDLTATAGSPVRGGFQLVVVDGNNANCGNLANVNGQAGTEFSGGREYIEQRGGKAFSGGSVNWDFQWTSPASVPGNTVRVYFIGNFCNGNNNSSGDFPIAASAFYDFAGAPPVTATISNITPVSCFGGNDGSATVEAGGGAPPYTYLWSNGQNGQTAVNLIAGTYTVTVTGSAGSGTATATATITQPAVLNQTVSVSGPVSCAQPLATATASAVGGTSPYTYAWSDGQTGNQAFFSSPGTYSVTVTDSKGCTKVNSVSITGNVTPPTAAAAPGSAITCIQSTTTVSGAGSSQGPNITYLWTTVNGNILAGANSMTATVNAAGTYVLTVTNTTNGCTSTASATVTANTTPPTTTLSAGTLNCADTVTAIQTTPSVPSSYIWSGPNGFSSTAQNPAVTSPGLYSVTVTGTQNGCTSTNSITVNQNTTPPQVTATDGLLNCLATSDTLVAGSNNSVSYAWSGPGGYSANTADAVVSAPGTYIVIVTDSINNCTASDTAQVIQNITDPTASAVTPEEVTCNEPAIQLDGTASSQGQNFVYLWSTPNGRIVSGANTLTPTVDTVGEYVLLVTNQTNGCTARDTVTVTQDPPLSNTTSMIPVSCNGASNGGATITVNGGSGNYDYLWSTGDTTSTALNLVAGVYSVTVEDDNGCTLSAAVTVTEPAVLSANAGATAETSNGANDGTATASPSGGTIPYTYEWSNGDTSATIINLAPGNYSVSVYDANGCFAFQIVTVNSFNCALSAQVVVTPVSCHNGSDGSAEILLQGAMDPVSYLWSTGDTTSSVSGLNAGIYQVEIVDGNNCPAELTATINQPSILLANVSSTPESGLGANDGTAGAAPTGGTAPYSFLWNNDSTTQTITGLAPGTYTVTVTDQNNCTVVRSVVVNAFNCVLNVTISSVNVQCAGAGDGQATALVNGGAQPLTYAWSTGDTTATISNLQPGQYGVTATDAEGCSTASSVTITEPDPIQVQIDVNPASCPESTDGSASIFISGGTGPYQWSGSLSSLAPGNYQLTVTDSRGCSKLENFSVGSNDTIVPVLLCPPGNFQACSSAPFEFEAPSFSDNCSLAGAVPVLVSGLPSGSIFPVGTTEQIYRLTDASGNTATCSFTVTTIEGPVVTLDTVNNDTGNAGLGGIFVTISGGSGPYQFEWRRDNQIISSEEDPQGLIAGTYVLVVLDANGCQANLGPVVVDNTVNTDGPTVTGGDFRILPNPAVDFIQLEIQNLKAAGGVIYDRYGRWIKSIPVSDLTLPIEVGELPDGLYFVRLSLENGQSVSKRWLKMN